MFDGVWLGKGHRVQVGCFTDNCFQLFPVVRNKLFIGLPESRAVDVSQIEEFEFFLDGRVWFDIFHHDYPLNRNHMQTA